MVLAMDTSRSMVAKDVPPSRLAVAQQAVRRFLENLPEGYRVGMVSFAQSGARRAAGDGEPRCGQAALRNLRTGDGTALGEGIARAVQVAQRVPAEKGKKPRRRSSSSPTAPRHRACSSRCRRRSARRS